MKAKVLVTLLVCLSHYIFEKGKVCFANSKKKNISPYQKVLNYYLKEYVFFFLQKED